MTQSEKDFAKIVEDAYPRCHAEISPVKVKDTHLMNNKLPRQSFYVESEMDGEVGVTYICGIGTWRINMTSMRRNENKATEMYLRSDRAEHDTAHHL